MAWFGRGQVIPNDVREELNRLDAEVRRLGSLLRTLEEEQATMHDQVRKWMRRAVAAERAAERNQERGAGTAPAFVTPAEPPISPLRARIMARRRGRAVPIMAEESNGGLHT